MTRTAKTDARTILLGVDKIGPVERAAQRAVREALAKSARSKPKSVNKKTNGRKKAR